MDVKSGWNFDSNMISEDLEIEVTGTDGSIIGLEIKARGLIFLIFMFTK